MLSDNPKNAARPPKTRPRSVTATNKRWSDTQKLEAVQMFLMTGSPTVTCAALKIPEQTLKNWRATEWWKELQTELKTQDDLQLSARMQKIVNRSLDQLEDRLENGEYMFDKYTGEVKRKPINALTALKITTDMMTRRDAVIERTFNGTSVTEDKVAQTLANLAESFAKIARQERPTIEVTDVIIGEMKHALHEERQEGLQDGVREVSQPPGADQESLGTDDGPSTE